MIGIEIGVAAQRVGGDRIGFYTIALARQRLCHDEAKEFRKLRQFAEVDAVHNAIKRGADFGVVRLSGDLVFQLAYFSERRRIGPVAAWSLAR